MSGASSRNSLRSLRLLPGSRVCATAMTAIAVVAMMACPALAQDLPPEVTERQAQGEAMFEAENYDAALVEFERVYDLLDGYPLRYFVLFNIGQCHERLFRYDQALAYYQRYLQEGGPEAEDRATVEATIRALEGLLGTVVVTSNIEGAEVWIDDRRVGTSPGSFRVPSGGHVVELRSEGYSPARAEATVAARREVSIELVLEALGADHGLHPALFVAGAGLTLASLGVAIGFWVDALVQHDAAVARSVRTDGSQYELVPEDLDAIGRSVVIGDVMLGVTGALAIGSFVLLLFTDWSGSRSSSPDVALMPWIGSDGAGLSVGGRL